jgi:hypothetical protein
VIFISCRWKLVQGLRYFPLAVFGAQDFLLALRSLLQLHTPLEFDFSCPLASVSIGKDSVRLTLSAADFLRSCLVSAPFP